MRVLIFDQQYSEVEKIKSVIQNEQFTIFGAATDFEVGEHLWFGQFDAVVIGKNVEKELHQRICELAKDKGTRVLEIQKSDENIEDFTREKILPELQEINKK